MSNGLSGFVLERNRPGIRFEVAVSPAAEALPRMDVAAFIGFAERGPLHCPVAVEDMGQFRKVFGETPQLGWSEDGGRYSGMLAESVNSFFIQGGRRCWIIRVAAGSARSNQFMLPGLFKVTSKPGALLVNPAIAQACCEGSWSDTLRVATRLVSRYLVLKEISANVFASSWEILTLSDIANAGDLLRIDMSAVPEAAGGMQQVFFPIYSVERNRNTGEFVLTVQAGMAFKSLQGEQVPIDDPAILLKGKASLVSVDLRVRDELTSEWRASDLGLTPLHPRYCGALPSDLDIYRPDAPQNGASLPFSAGASVDSSPWFPLAAIEDDQGTEARSFMVPLGMDAAYGDEELSVPISGSKLDRDGLSSFDASQFLDPDLRNASLYDLLERSNDIRYTSPKARRLQGMHAVLGWFSTRIQDEVSLIAIPDAIHSPWQSQQNEQCYISTVSEIQQQEGAEIPLTFECCQQLTAPSGLSASNVEQAGRQLKLVWEKPDNIGEISAEYQVQESLNENFLLVEQAWQTRDTTLLIPVTAPGRRIYRVCASTATQVSAWSAAIAVNIVEEVSVQSLAGIDNAVTREIQRELVKLCVAHGEMFAVLSLPPNISTTDAASHARSMLISSSAVTSGSNVLFDPEGRIGSYAAVYHPWIETITSTGSVQPLPPDGAIVGMIASRTLDRGAWIAPANRVLKGVVALHSALSAAQQTQLAASSINLVLQRLEGFTLLSEDTLSSVADFLPVHVRRLLILLRRILLRLGEEFTFETSNMALRDLIRLRCRNMLERMYRAGAFNGKNADDAFQVSIDDADNPQASIDAGRLVVRVRIRPAKALRFITIRFSLGGGTSGITGESAA